MLRASHLTIPQTLKLDISTNSRTEYCYKRSSCQSLGIDTSFHYV
ncbi:hypothetical protein HMPREF9999_00637 [Alloprevotella sp. oral taxon 473 str. F0040]|nr:hypothetical protein HMPREF9999_00637 [Alloprevotella sp. oral taxon 473 str. F0040]